MLRPRLQPQELTEHELELSTAILKRVGKSSMCRCGQRVYRVPHLDGKKRMYNSDGTKHYATCAYYAQLPKDNPTTKEIERYEPDNGLRAN